MFEKVLNERVSEYLVRSKLPMYEKNLIPGLQSKYYVEYFQERLYWLYDYDKKLITMIYAYSPNEAVMLYEETR